MGCIYLIRNLKNNKCYIGQTIHDAVKGRINDHLNETQNGSRLIKRAIKKYGKDAFAYEILHDGIIPEFLDTLEIEAIAKFKTLAPHGYNLRTGGGGGSLSEETRRKISEAKTGHEVSLETRRKLSKAFKGKPLSEEHRRKMSEAHKGIKHSKEACLKISKARKGKKLPEETRRKISESKKGIPAKPFSKEHRQNISRAKQGKHVSPDKAPARDFFFSLPSDIPLCEKRRLLREKFPQRPRTTLNQWVRQWEDEKI